eukprot:2331447-Pyramimonas_sp.AAC.1
MSRIRSYHALGSPGEGGAVRLPGRNRPVHRACVIGEQRGRPVLLLLLPSPPLPPLLSPVFPSPFPPVPSGCDLRNCRHFRRFLEGPAE